MTDEREKADIVSRLREPLTDNEQRVMQHWDAIRRLLLEEQNRGSLPRDFFESLLCDLDEEREEAATEIATLRQQLAEARAKAFEEAARIADKHNIADDWENDDLGDVLPSVSARLIAAAIRKLAEPE